MSDEIKQALKLLRNNGYAATRWTRFMNEAAKDAKNAQGKGTKKIVADAHIRFAW